jgi:L-fucose isomerase-like protein
MTRTHGRRDLLLGLCPIGKFVFSHEDALRQKAALTAQLAAWGVTCCIPDGVVPDGMLRGTEHVQPLLRFFREKGVDALFIPHCNFGTEDAAALIARDLGVPVLLWGPRDETPLSDGSRLRDSLCGTLATSKVLRKLHVPFSYIESCRLDDPAFRAGLFRFLGAARAAQALRTMRIGQIGVRIDFFWTTIANESELLERFGIEVVPFDIAEVLARTVDRARREREGYLEELARIRAEWLDARGNDEGFINALAWRDELLFRAAENRLDAFSVQSFSSIQDTLGPGQGVGDCLLQEQVPVAAESDIHGAVSSVLLEAAAGGPGPSFFPEYTIRHPENDNAVLLWHGTAPLSLRHPAQARVRMEPPWILKDLPPANPGFRLKDGPLTICRFDGDTGDYRLGIGEGRTVDGPSTREIFAWMEVDDWPGWERRVAEGPYIHHCSAIYEHCADTLVEACRFIPGLTPQRLDRPWGKDRAWS